MIGTALDLPKCKKIVKQLGTLQQPWNCPHGRPTIRHLIDLDELNAMPAVRAFEESRFLPV